MVGKSSNPMFFATPAAFRRWLQKNHDRATELLVGFYKKDSGRPSITWPVGGAGMGTSATPALPKV